MIQFYLRNNTHAPHVVRYFWQKIMTCNSFHHDKMLGHVSNGAPLGKIGHNMGIIRDKMVDFGFFGPWTWIFELLTV